VHNTLEGVVFIKTSDEGRQFATKVVMYYGKYSSMSVTTMAVADLGFFGGGDCEPERVSIDGVWAYGRTKFERL